VPEAHLRVVHLVPQLFGAHDAVYGGAERYALELARHMAETVDTTLLTFGDRTRAETIGQLRIKIIGNPHHVRNQQNNMLAWGLFPNLRRADIVHCHQQHVLASSLAALYCRMSGRKVFASDLGGGGWDISSYISTDAWYHGLLHISEYSRMIAGHENNPRAHVILGGVDTQKFSPAPSIKPRDYVLFVGRLLPHKGIDDLIRAMPDDLELQIIGQAYDQRYFDDLRRLAESKRTVFRRDCDDAQLIEAYRGALCVVLPSVYRTMYHDQSAVPELLGQTLLEGMACGVPAICTRVASMPEIVDDGVTGFIVPPNDPAALREKICWIRDRPADAAAIGSRARERVLDKFTWSRVVNRCLAIYGADPAVL
jgi:glycosyltransferase involved in cell wall biosynthesis